MKIAVVGTGYVGLVTGTCFAERGNDVVCIDVDANKVAQMREGKVPIYEPGLDDLFKRNIQEGRLHFETELDKVVGSAVIFLALPTPQGEDGSADLSYVEKVARDLGPLIQTYTVVVDKSTVPVGTAQHVYSLLAERAPTDLFDVVSNPEFLREGQAVNDFLHPERVVLGVSSKRAGEVMTKLYESFVRRSPEGRLLVMDTASAELTKYAANALLATKISFMNGLTELCQKVGADINEIRRGIGTDSRIGNQFLYAGPGYGGSCFPKDTNALLRTGKDYGITLNIVQATIEVNERQKHVVSQKVIDYFNGSVEGKTIALWGLAFKDNTDDIRESPALAILDDLIAKGAVVVAFDPQATEPVKRAYADTKQLSFADNEYSALKGADALVIATNWAEFYSPDFAKIKKLLKQPVVFDGRNLYAVSDMKAEGFHYESIGRATAN